MLVVIGFLIGYIYKSKKEIKQSFISQHQLNKNSIINDNTLKPTLIKNPMAFASNWKTYLDVERKFSFQYPYDLFLKVDDNNSNFNLVRIYFYSDKDLIKKNYYFSESLFSIDITIKSKSSYKTFEQRKTEGDASIFNIEKYIDFQERIWATNGPVLGMADISNYEVEINHKDKYYHIKSQAYGKKLGNYLKKELIIQEGNYFDATPLLKEHTNLIQKIISTFKFID